MIFIFSPESAPRWGEGGGGRGRGKGEGGQGGERGGSGNEGRRHKEEGAGREGECGRGWLLVVVGRASKAVVQTSGTMEAQPWYSNPIAEGVGAAAGAAAAGADARAGAGNTADAGVQAKNGDNTKAAPTGCRSEGGCEGGPRDTVERRRRADTTLDISYPSARNPLTS